MSLQIARTKGTVLHPRMLMEFNGMRGGGTFGDPGQGVSLRSYGIPGIGLLGEGRGVRAWGRDREAEWACRQTEP